MSARQLTRGDDVKKTLELEFDISVSYSGVLCLLLFYFMSQKFLLLPHS